MPRTGTACLLTCQYCGKDNIKTQHGLRFHQEHNGNCRLIQQNLNQEPQAQAAGPELANEAAVADNVARPPRHSVARPAPLPPAFAEAAAGMDELLEFHERTNNVNEFQQDPIAFAWNNHSDFVCNLEDDDSFDENVLDRGYGKDAANGFDVYQLGNDRTITCIDNQDYLAYRQGEESAVRSHKYLDRFRKYLVASKDNPDFTEDEILSIEMLHELFKKGCPMNIFEDLMKVVLRHEGKLLPGQPLQDLPSFVSRTKIMGRLATRYGMYPMANVEEAAERKKQGLRKCSMPDYYIKKSVVLPSSGARIPVYVFDFGEELVKLLSDPRLDDKCWDFFNDDPLAPPPNNWDVIGNIPDGRAFRATYKERIQRQGLAGKRMLLGIIGYVDNTSTAQFADLGYEPFKFSLAQFTEEVCLLFIFIVILL